MREPMLPRKSFSEASPHPMARHLTEQDIVDRQMQRYQVRRLPVQKIGNRTMAWLSSWVLWLVFVPLCSALAYGLSRLFDYGQKVGWW